MVLVIVVVVVVLPPTMTSSRRWRQATVSVVDMSRTMDINFSLGISPHHRHCYDDRESTRRRRAARNRHRRRRHDYGNHDDDDVEMIDSVDPTPRYVKYLSRDDVSSPTTDDHRRTRPMPVPHRRWSCSPVTTISSSCCCCVVLLLPLTITSRHCRK